MRHEALGKHCWPAIGLLLYVCAGSPARAQNVPPVSPVQIAIGSPTPNGLVAGKITLSVAYNTGMGAHISAFTVYVDDAIQYSRNFIGMNTRGVHYLELDTRTLADGNHTVRVVAVGRQRALSSDSVDLIVRNGVAGGPDLVPPLVQFRSLIDGDSVQGKIGLEVLAEDNVTFDPLVSVWVRPLLGPLADKTFSLGVSNRPPFLFELNTADYLDSNTGLGKIRLEAWAFDKIGNRGVARPITLNVVPVGTRDQTPAKADPTSPVTTKPGKPDLGPLGAPEPVTDPMAGRLTIPLPPRERIPGVKGPASKPTPAPMVWKPAPAKPQGTQMARNFSAPPPAAAPSPARVEPPTVTAPSRRPSAPVAEDGSRLIIPLPSGKPTASPDSLRTSVPVVPPAPARALPAPAPRPGGMPDQPERTAAAPPALSGNRDSMPPSGRPESSLPVDMAGRVADPAVSPEKAALRAAPSAGSRASEPAARPGRLKPAPAPLTRVARGPGSRNPEIVPSTAAPQPKPAPAKVSPQPKPAPVALARKPESRPLIIVPDPTAKPDKPGRVPMKVYEVRIAPTPTSSGLPQDRAYRLRPGDTLNNVARRFKVTPKSLLVANGLREGRLARAGSIIKVPGTFDVVLNDRLVAFDVAPRVDNGLALAPFRQIFEYAGGVVVYYPDTREIRAANEQTEVKLHVGSKEALVRGMVVVMDREAFIDSGRTIVPINFVEQALDLKAEYDPKTGTIHLVHK